MTIGPIAGLVPILATPFHDDGSLDEDSMRRLVRFQLDCGVDGVGLFGFASESFALSEAERKRILTATIDEVAGAVPIIAGAGGNGIPPAIEQAEQMLEHGADALMVLPPSVIKPDGDGLIEFYGALGEAAQASIMIQDAPGITGVGMAPALLASLAELACIDSVKIEQQPTAARVADVVAAVDGMMDVLGGQNALFVLDELERGAIGTMPACEVSDIMRAILDMWDRGDHDDARELHHRLLPLLRYGLQPGLAWAIHKEVLRMGGIISSARVRGPGKQLDEATRRGLLHTLTTLELKALSGT